MGMDRNTIIGFVLLGVLLFVYLFTSTKSSNEAQALTKRRDDSIAQVMARKAAADAAAAKMKDTARAAGVPVDTTGFNLAFQGTEQTV
ncbi:MAG: membrane protein insertase YidC, partial [Bacteroidetes bacterium]|nr:membrane protein insertase YidC [Bacteroidota bacterium]